MHHVRTNDFITSGTHLLLLVIGFKINTPIAWGTSLSLISLISLWAWITSYKYHRIISDTPTSRVASAAQGYIELCGRAAMIPGIPVLSKLTQLPCVWYRYIIEERDGDKWRHVESGCSDETFALIDATGECVIDPERADVITSRKEIWIKNNYRYTEYILIANDPLYVIGEFMSIGGANSELNFNKDLEQVLKEWKKDKKKLTERFDLNNDGEIDLKEWMLARQEAKRTVQKEHRAIRARSSVHIMRNSKDGRLYLISNLAPEQLAGKYHFWSWAHITIFFVAGGAALINFL